MNRLVRRAVGDHNVLRLRLRDLAGPMPAEQLRAWLASAPRSTAHAV